MDLDRAYPESLNRVREPRGCRARSRMGAAAVGYVPGRAGHSSTAFCCIPPTPAPALPPTLLTSHAPTPLLAVPRSDGGCNLSRDRQRAARAPLWVSSAGSWVFVRLPLAQSRLPFLLPACCHMWFLRQLLWSRQGFSNCAEAELEGVWRRCHV